MSRFLHDKYGSLRPYTPGEQPAGAGLIKLNTNENPFPPSPKVIEVIRSAEADKLHLYPDPEAKTLIKAVSSYYDIPENRIMAGNGSDELLAFSFMAFAKNDKVIFPDISYGFYEVYAQVFGVKAKKAPLTEDLDVKIEDYFDADSLVVLANPNAQTGTVAGPDKIEEVLKSNEENLVLIDEAYVDFGAESCLPLIKKYDNLLVIQTFSKARNLAGGRVGMAFANEKIIEDLNKIKYSFNPYNLNRLSILAATAAIEDNEYFEACIREIKKIRKEFVLEMEKLRFYIVPSMANFVLARHELISGEAFYKALRERNILVRHFQDERIKDYVRITIGNREEMEALVFAAKKILSKEGL